MSQELRITQAPRDPLNKSQAAPYAFLLAGISGLQRDLSRIRLRQLNLRCADYGLPGMPEIELAAQAVRHQTYNHDLASRYLDRAEHALDIHLRVHQR